MRRGTRALLRLSRVERPSPTGRALQSSLTPCFPHTQARLFIERGRQTLHAGCPGCSVDGSVQWQAAAGCSVRAGTLPPASIRPSPHVQTPYRTSLPPPRPPFPPSRSRLSSFSPAAPLDRPLCLRAQQPICPHPPCIVVHPPDPVRQPCLPSCSPFHSPLSL